MCNRPVHAYSSTLIHCYTYLPLSFTAIHIFLLCAVYNRPVHAYSSTLIHCHTYLPLSFTAIHIFHSHSLAIHMFLLCAVYNRPVHLLWPGEVGETEWAGFATASWVSQCNPQCIQLNQAHAPPSAATCLGV